MVTRLATNRTRAASAARSAGCALPLSSRLAPRVRLQFRQTPQASNPSPLPSKRADPAGCSMAKSELAFPVNTIRPGLCEKRGIKFNRVARLELRFAEQPGRQFQCGDVTGVHVLA